MQTTPHIHSTNGAMQAPPGGTSDAQSLDRHAPAHGAHGPDHTQPAPSRVAVAGHPIHPMLIPFPITALLGALVADLAAWWTGDAFWARAALWLTAAGMITGGAAALFGLADFLTIERARAHRVGRVHAIGAGLTLALAAASWLVRLADPVAAVLPWGLVLSALTAAALVVTGWTGGDLPYRHLIGVTGHGPHDGGHAGQGHGHGASDASAHGRAVAASAVPAAHGRPADGHGGPEHAGMDHGHTGMMHMERTATGPQVAVVAVLTNLALVVAFLFSASYANLTLGAHDVGGLVMPPGMIMTRETSGAAMRDMAAVDPRAVANTAPADARGDQPLQPRLEDGVKVFDLEASVIRWNILPDTPVLAYAFNGQVPGPRIVVQEGDRVRIDVTNRLPESTTVHWHGLILPNAMDGPAEITQEPIRPGERFSYEFTTAQAGTFFYHSHDHVDRQQALGLYGALIIEPRERPTTPGYDQELVVQLQEWLHRDGYTYPAMPMEGALPNYFTINGKAYPATETVRLRVGERLLVRFIGSSSGFIHPMHIHGGPFRIVETDGYPVPEAAQLLKDTVNVGPGERYDVIWEAREPGRWLLHCHINHHTTNNNREEQGGGGLMLILEVSP